MAVPGIPAIDYVAEAPSQNLDDWPAALRQPLIKVDCESVSTEMHSVASGVRSALVKIDGKWFRLKGCGNYEQGFPLRHSKQSLNRDGSVKEPWRDIRGCAFWHTAVRENVMTSKVAASLGPLGITACNKPLGIFEYSAPHQPLGAAMPPCCIVMETRGDRRLGTHVLAGLAMLLPQLIDLDAVDMPTLMNTFPAHRRIGSNSLMSTDTLMTGEDTM